MQNRLAFKGTGGTFSSEVDAKVIQNAKPAILDIRFCMIEKGGEQRVSDILHDHLQELALINCELTDAAVNEIIKCKSIKNLRISQNKVTKDGLVKILKQMPKLERLDLTGNCLAGDITQELKEYQRPDGKKLKLFIRDNKPNLRIDAGINYQSLDIDIQEQLTAEQKLEKENADCIVMSLDSFLGTKVPGRVLIDVAPPEKSELKLIAELKAFVTEKGELKLHNPTTEHLKLLPKLLKEEKDITAIQIRNYPFNGRKVVPKIVNSSGEIVDVRGVSNHHNAKDEGLIIHDEDQMLEILAGLNVSSLTLDTCNIGPDEAKIIAKNPNVVRLKLPSNPLGNKGFESLMHGLPKLGFLNVGGNEFNDPRILRINDLYDIQSFELGMVRKAYQLPKLPLQVQPKVVPPLLKKDEKDRKSENIGQGPLPIPLPIKKRPSDKEIKCVEACERTLQAVERHILKTNWKLSFYLLQGEEFVAEDKQKYRVPTKVLPQLKLINAERKKEYPDWKAACESFYTSAKSAASKSKKKDKIRQGYFALFKDADAFVEKFCSKEDAELVKSIFKK